MNTHLRVLRAGNGAAPTHFTLTLGHYKVTGLVTCASTQQHTFVEPIIWITICLLSTEEKALSER